MMQVPVPQHLGSSLIGVFQGLTISATVIGNSMIVKLHVGAAQCPVFGCAAFHALAPHPKRTGLQLVPHEANDVRL